VRVRLVDSDLGPRMKLTHTMLWPLLFCFAMVQPSFAQDKQFDKEAPKLKVETKKHHYKYQYKDPRCKYKYDYNYKSGKTKVKEKGDCRGAAY